MAGNGFIKMWRSDLIDELISGHPLAWALLCIIARRADYQTGKAFIGDYRVLGKKVTENQYRTAKKCLAAMGLCSFVGLPKKGTEASLINDEIFDLNMDFCDENTAQNNNGIDNRIEHGIDNRIIEVDKANNSRIEHGIDNGINNDKSTSNKNEELNNKLITKKVNQKNRRAPDLSKNGKVLGLSKSKRFKKPTVSEIAEYCRERKNKLDPGKIFDHYEANGWKRGKTAIKDWKACVRTWEGNNNNQGGAGGRSSQVFRNSNQSYKQVEQKGGY